MNHLNVMLWSFLSWHDQISHKVLLGFIWFDLAPTKIFSKILKEWFLKFLNLILATGAFFMIILNLPMNSKELQYVLSCVLEIGVCETGESIWF